MNELRVEVRYLQSALIVNPKSFSFKVVFSTVPPIVYCASSFPCPVWRHLYFPKLNSICHFSDHSINLLRSMDELKVTVIKVLVRSILKWVGHAERLGDDKLTQRADAQKMKGKRRPGWPRLRWEDCVKRDVEKVGEGGRITARDRRSWRLLTENVVTKKTTETMASLTYDDRDAKRRTTTNSSRFNGCLIFPMGLFTWNGVTPPSHWTARFALLTRWLDISHTSIACVSISDISHSITYRVYVNKFHVRTTVYDMSITVLPLRIRLF